MSLANFQRKEVEILHQVENPNEDQNYFPNIYGVILEGDVVYIFMTFVGQFLGFNCVETEKKNIWKYLEKDSYD